MWVVLYINGLENKKEITKCVFYEKPKQTDKELEASLAFCLEGPRT